MKLFKRFYRNYCHICDMSFKNYLEYQSHVLDIHNNGISDEGIVFRKEVLGQLDCIRDMQDDILEAVNRLETKP